MFLVASPLLFGSSSRWFMRCCFLLHHFQLFSLFRNSPVTLRAECVFWTSTRQLENRSKDKFLLFIFLFHSNTSMTTKTTAISSRQTMHTSRALVPKLIQNDTLIHTNKAKPTMSSTKVKRRKKWGYSVVETFFHIPPASLQKAVATPTWFEHRLNVFRRKHESLCKSSLTNDNPHRKISKMEMKNRAFPLIHCSGLRRLELVIAEATLAGIRSEDYTMLPLISCSSIFSTSCVGGRQVDRGKNCKNEKWNDCDDENNKPKNTNEYISILPTCSMFGITSKFCQLVTPNLRPAIHASGTTTTATVAS